jgi:hypothetical protein
MSKTFTPTHCPETGRKFTKAERKAANKAKYAAMRSAQAAPAQKAKPSKAKASKPTPAAPVAPSVTDLKVLMRHTKAELCQMIQGYQVLSLSLEQEPAAPAKPKACKRKPVKASRPNANERLEARMQRESTRKREAMLAKADERSRKVVDAVTGKDAEAFAERKEVYVAPTEHKGSAKQKLTGLQGLTPEDAARRDALLREREALEAALLADFEGFEDAPF